MSPQITRHANAATSALLAAALCMSICQIISMIMGEPPSQALLWGLSLATMTFGLTYAGAFFGQLIHTRSAR